ncbi:MAG: sigma-70 family RNA polymerase sigma factor [Phycisphaerales bacterium]|nr:sigma-70 family RNA polymerase sigma factor [Phycisphaerales bacterium]
MDHRETGPTTSEHELVERCKRGDREAQRTLYEQTSQRVFRLLTRMTRSAEIAEDLAQETYLKAFSAIATFDQRSAVHTWLYRIAVNEALQWLRRRKPTLLDPEIAAARPDPRNNGHDSGAHLDIEEAMAALDPTERAMLLLRYQEGLDYRAIAEVTEVAMGTVGSRLNRAREQLRELLKDFEPGREEIQSDKHRIRHGREGADRIVPSVEERAS